MTLNFPRRNPLLLLDQREGRSSSCSRAKSGSRSMLIPSDSPSAMSFAQSILPLEIIARSLLMPDRIVSPRVPALSKLKSKVSCYSNQASY